MIAKLPKDEAHVSQRRTLVCMEKMFKTVANSLYGYLNYRFSIVYAPAVAAAITLFSRKTFHEMTWICENYIPRWIEGARCVTIYRDTDGAMFFVNKPIPHNDILRKVNRLLGSSESLGSIMLELENSDCRLCSIMSRNKYWKVIGGEEDGGGKGVAMSYITKGFGKNAKPFVKFLVRILQARIYEYIVSRMDIDRKLPFLIKIEDYVSFFGSIFDALQQYQTEHGIGDFAFKCR